jgi:hypothetical protein
MFKVRQELPVGELSHVVLVLLSMTGGPTSTSSAEPIHVELVPDLLTQLNDALTAAAILIGGLFAYFKFFRGRVLSAAVSLELKGSMTPDNLHRQRSVLHKRFGSQPATGALLVEVAVRNNGQRSLTVPRGSNQLISISSVTKEALARAGQGLSQRPMGWKLEDAYFASANILLDNDEQPREDIKLGPGDVLTLAAVFPVPSRHNAAAFLVVMNGYAESQGWFRRTVKTPEIRTLVVPDQRAD